MVIPYSVEYWSSWGSVLKALDPATYDRNPVKITWVRDE